MCRSMLHSMYSTRRLLALVPFLKISLSGKKDMLASSALLLNGAVPNLRKPLHLFVMRGHVDRLIQFGLDTVATLPAVRLYSLRRRVGKFESGENIDIHGTIISISKVRLYKWVPRLR